ncbi:MAG: hypothetical protein FD153_1768, partial [Rhodospirillaceae bacterium]
MSKVPISGPKPRIIAIANQKG